MGRTSNLILLAAYLLAAPAGVFMFFTSPRMGYAASTAGIIAGVLALVGLALIPAVIRKKPVEANAPVGALPAKTGWVVLIGFLVVMVALVVYTIATNN